MKEIYKTRLYEMDPKYRTEIMQFLVVPFIGIVVLMFFTQSFERYQIVILTLIVVIIFFIEIYKLFDRRYLHVMVDSDKKMQILIKKKESILYEIQNIESGSIGWNYRISASLSQVEIYSITHRTNHNLVLKIKSDDGSKKLNLIQKLKPWQELPSNYPYLNDLDPSEMAYKIHQIEELNQILVKYKSN